MPAPRVTRTEETYQYLLAEILRGRWQVGDIVSTNALAEELSLSRTPVLQALKRLESEGLVEIIPQVGCRILHPTGGALADLYALRAAIEGITAAVAALELDGDELAALEVTLRRLDEAAAAGDPATYARLDERLHMAVTEGAGLPRLAEVARTMWAQMRPQLDALPRVTDGFEASRTEHRELYEALRHRAPRHARSAAERHARLSAVRHSAGLLTRTKDMLVHRALVYERDEDFLATVVPFIKEGLQLGEQVLVVTTSRNVELLARTLGTQADAVEMRDANDWYVLPSHTLLSYERYIEQAETQRVRIVGEVAWNGESRAPMREWIRYEAALNIAFATQPATIICPYDLRELPEEILAGARRTHPELCAGEDCAPSPDFSDATAFVREIEREDFGAPPSGTTSELAIRGNMREVREFVIRQAKRAGVSGKALQDAFLAVQEVASSAIAHGSDRGSIRAWIADGALVFEVTDAAAGVGDPLVGQLASDPAMQLEPRGLWMARLLCDLVEVRSGDRGLVMRLHVALQH